MKLLEIHDATKDVIKNVGGFFTGMLPLNFAGGKVGEALGIIKEVSGAGLDARDASKMSHGVASDIGNAFGEKGTKSGKIGIIVHMYPISGYTSTGAKKLTMKELAKFAYS